MKNGWEPAVLIVFSAQEIIRKVVIGLTCVYAFIHEADILIY